MYFIFYFYFVLRRKGIFFSLSSFDLADSWVRMSTGYVYAVFHISNSVFLLSYLLLVFYLYFFARGFVNLAREYL